VRRSISTFGCLAVLIAALLATGGQASVAAPSAQPAKAVLPLFAYYYQWFDPSSWNRAKIDYPEAGRYSSDDPHVMRQQIEQAKQAGITGFIVSWKDTVTNTRRLRALVELAAQEHFSLAMIYQGLDFNRHPLPVSKVAADFETFLNQFAQNPVFYRLGGKPLTIWSGTWAYSHADVAQVTNAVRAGMLVLSTEKTVVGYKRIADVTDGDAYYWSSVNPTTNPTYGTKLQQMSDAIHSDGKYWIAPFASGFDARLIGGKNVVPRNDGATMRTEYANALRSSPDALGLISWNEFSENTYVEPSRQYGHRYLDVLAELRNTPAPSPSSAVDSSGTQPGARSGPNRLNIVLLVSLPVALVLVVGILARRRRRRASPRLPTDGGNSPVDVARSRSGRSSS
jgi:Glycosyl hydrolase family 71